MPERLYLAGPITGKPKHNYPAFRAAKARLIAAGYEVVSPVDLNEAEGITESTDITKLTRDQVASLLIRDLEAIRDMECSGIALLDGWSNSLGTAVEVAFARFRDIPFETTDAWLERRAKHGKGA